MKKIFPFYLLFPAFVFFWVPRLAYGGIAYVGGSATTCAQTSGTTASRTCSLGSPTTAGDAVVVGVAWKTTSRTIVGVTAPGCTFFPYQQSAVNSTSEAVALWVGLNCPAISAVTVTLSGGSVFETTVNEYSGVASVGQLTAATGTSTAPAASIVTQDSNNWIVMESGSLGSDGLPTADTGNLRSAGRTGSTVSDVAVAACDNSVSVPGNVTCSDTIASGAWVTLTIEMRTTNPADPLLVDAVGTSTNGSTDSGNGFVVNLPQAALTGNAIICGVTYPYLASRTLTISDNGGNVWNTAVTLNNGTTNTISIVYAKNVAPGTETLTFTFDAAVFDFQVACKEAYHISTAASPVDGTSSNNNSGFGLAGPIVSSGSITTSTAGDLIFQYGQWFNAGSDLNTGSQGVLGFAPGNGWSSVVSNTMTGQFFQNVQLPGAGTITPSYDVEAYPGGIANSWATVAAAFKTDNTKGTPPPSTGIHIDHEDTVMMLGGNNPIIQIPADGNFLTIATTPTGNTFAANDSAQNNYTVSVPGPDAILMYATASATNTSQKILVTNSGGNNAELVVRDIRGVASSSPIDAIGSNGGLQSSFTAGTSITNAPQITLSAPNELVIFAMQNGCGPPQKLSSPSGAITDSVYFTGQIDADTFDEGEGHGHFFASTAGTLSATWVMQNTACAGNGNSWGGAAWAITAGTSQGGVPPAPPTNLRATVN